MSTTSKKAPIDPKSKEKAENLLTTADAYRELDAYLRAVNAETSIRRKGMARNIADVGEEMVAEIEEKNKEREKKRIQMIEFIYDKSKEEFVTLKEANKLPFEEIGVIYQRVVETKKPWWRQLVNLFR